MQNYARLLKNIKDAIHEGQVKLGYADEVIRLYYMEPSLLYLLGMEEKDKHKLASELELFEQHCREREEEIQVSHEQKRYCFSISRELSKKVHETYKDNRFLEQLAKVLFQIPCNIDTILEVFRLQSDEVICEKCDGMEFDYVIYYKDPSVDEYKYCFTIDEMHAYYHRFTDFDYQSIL